ncbi:MAG: hypothetical protein KatS3mg054_1077 [Chloroflexus sp.]|nr:MAG: hypothetical protein KatS3mg054_1077 [Chloroflexus sp.]
MDLGGAEDSQKLMREIFPYLYEHCNPNSERDPVIQGGSSEKLKELNDVYRKSPVYTYEPGLTDMSFLMVPCVAAARYGLGIGQALHGIIEWLRNLLPQPQPQPVPKERKKAA